MSINNKKRYRPIHKYKIGQWVYVCHEGVLERVLISGILFDYNTMSEKTVFTKPAYKVELYVHHGTHHSIFVEEYEIFKTVEECVAYVLEHGLMSEHELIKEEEENG